MNTASYVMTASALASPLGATVQDCVLAQATAQPQLSPDFLIPVPKRLELEPAAIAPHPDLPLGLSASERMMALVNLAAPQLNQRLSAYQPEEVLLAWIKPAQHPVLNDAWFAALQARLPSVYRQLPVTTIDAEALDVATLIPRLATRSGVKRKKAVVLAGVDSLISASAIADLAEREAVLSESVQTGKSASEAASLVLFEEHTSLNPALEILASVTVLPESVPTVRMPKKPKNKKVPPVQPTALSLAMQQALSEAKLTDDGLMPLLFTEGLAPERLAQTTEAMSQVWPELLKMEQRFPERIYTSPGLGHVGAARLPILLSLASGVAQHTSRLMIPLETPATNAATVLIVQQTALQGEPNA